MAILNNIRKRGIFLIIIIAMALFAFILSDVLTKDGSVKGQEVAATINGEEISRIDFMEKVDATQKTFGPNGTTSQAMTTVWDRELRRVVQNQEFEKLGINVSDDQLNESLRLALSQNPTFQNGEGVYDQFIVDQYVANIRLSNPTAYRQWVDFVESNKSNIAQTTYYNLIKSGLRSTLVEGEREYRFENDKINVEYIHIPYSSISNEEFPIGNDEIKKYMNEHKDEFEAEAQADIQYVQFTEEPTQEDIDGYRVEVAKYLDDTIEYNNVTKANDTLLGLRNTTNYEEYVNTNSDVQFNPNWLFKNKLPVAVADTLFNMQVGDIYGPYQLDNTYAVSKIAGISRIADTAKARHILIRYAGLQTAPQDVVRTKEDAQRLADSISGVVKRDLGKFEAMASEFSEDLSNNTKGGDLGDFVPGAMVPAFNDFVFEGTKGETGVVETNFGFHVVNIQDLRNEQKVIKLASIVKDVEASEKTLNTIFSNASKFEVAAKDGNFAEIATAQGLAPKPVNKMGMMDANIPGVGNNRSVVSWAFDEESNVGDVRRFSIPDGYIVVQITRRAPKGMMSVAEASSKVTPILRNIKKAEKIRASVTGTTLLEQGQSQSVQVKNASALTMSAPTIPGAGAEPSVIGAAFGKDVNGMTGLIDGTSGVFNVLVLSKTNAPDLESYATYVNQLNQKVGPTVNTVIYNALKENAEVEDNRSDFF